MIRVTAFGEGENEWRDRYIGLTKRLIPFKWDFIRIKRCPNRRTDQYIPEEKTFLETHKNFLILDVNGENINSDQFYKLCFSRPEIHFVVGPPVGFHRDFFRDATKSISLSKLTLTHELAQLVLAESLYRSACMLKNHPFVK